MNQANSGGAGDSPRKSEHTVSWTATSADSMTAHAICGTGGSTLPNAQVYTETQGKQCNDLGGEAANVGQYNGASYTYGSSLELCQLICNTRDDCVGVDHAGTESSGYTGGSQCYLTLIGSCSSFTTQVNWAHYEKGLKSDVMYVATPLTIDLATTDCVSNDVTAIAGSACKCSASATTNECAVNKYCYLNSAGSRTCSDVPKGACVVPADAAGPTNGALGGNDPTHGGVAWCFAGATVQNNHDCAYKCNDGYTAIGSGFAGSPNHGYTGADRKMCLNPQSFACQSGETDCKISSPYTSPYYDINRIDCSFCSRCFKKTDGSACTWQEARAQRNGDCECGKVMVANSGVSKAASDVHCSTDETTDANGQVRMQGGNHQECNTTTPTRLTLPIPIHNRPVAIAQPIGTNTRTQPTPKRRASVAKMASWSPKMTMAGGDKTEIPYRGRLGQCRCP